MQMSAWTDERVDALKRLWAEGLSASQIAAELGSVSRNAVIGKVHRLGLASRKTTSVKTSRTKVVRPLERPQPKQVVSRPSVMVMRGNAVVKVQEEAYPSPSAEVMPIFPRVTMMELKPSSCKWPIGDPMSPDFRFCGAKTENGAPYCSYHACLAYQPRAVRDRRRH